MSDTIERNMFYGAKPIIFEKAKFLRKNMTSAEKLLWDELKNKKVGGYRFRAQHPIDIFIADFYCHSLKLVIEVDGKIHIGQKEYDSGREHEMQFYGIRILRFTNKEVMELLENVILKIRKAIKERESEMGYTID
ncbi:endonuclease domain-containing protein [Plebeiibacterium marinum]|uniref:Endonuclease domain-containing protein n=1 Tax=Plebeiibacterium marinum TaxID=2992111 RepID=A0AAE3ME33_9BACT|nr:endonuclease domain-containing protein [Plebeiobacterium marinum]MCW3806074.1 endonuclease domain-containing protein [Plebeiobacterium marinum]